MRTPAFEIVRQTAYGAAAAFMVMTFPAAAAQDGREGCVTDFREGQDYFPAKIELEHATGFTVTYHDHYKVMTIRSPSDNDSRDVMVLVHCGTPVPPLEGELAGAAVITIPVQTIAANRDVSLTRARVLGYADRVVGAGSDGIYDPGLRDRVTSGKALKIGDSFHGEPDYEKLLTAAPDIVFLTTASLEHADSLVRARALGLPATPTMSWVEPSVLGQAEWLYQVAVFFNAEAAANDILDDIKERYEALSALANARPDRPTIIWLDLAEQRDQWRVPESNWKAALIKDAGAQSPWANSDGPPTRVVTTEQIESEGVRAKAFVAEHATLNEPGRGALDRVKAVRDGVLYDVHKRSRPEHGAYDWYESAVVEVDRVLEDLVAVTHPDLMPNHEFRHLQRVRRSGSRQVEN